MRKFAFVIMSMVIVITVLFIGIVFAAEPAKEVTPVDKVADSAAIRPEYKMVTLYVSGLLEGDKCVRHLTRILSALNGVDKVVVNVEKGTVDVTYDPAKVQPEALVAEVARLNHPTTLTAPAAKSSCDSLAGKQEKGCPPKAGKAKSDDEEKGATCDPKTKTCTPGK